jgi:hypothetical protein
MSDEKKEAALCVVCGEPAPVTQLDYFGIPALCPEHLYCPECFAPFEVMIRDAGAVGALACNCGTGVTCHDTTTQIEETAWRVPWVLNFLRGHWRLRKPNQPGIYFVQMQAGEVTLASVMPDGHVSPIDMTTLIVAWWSASLPNLPALK